MIIFKFMKRGLLLLSLIILLLLSCDQSQDEGRWSRYEPRVVETNGYIVPNDSISEPKVNPVDESKLKIVKAGKPEVIPANLNVYPIGQPMVFRSGKPRVCSPGKDTFSLPKVVPAIDKSSLAGIPEIYLAKDPSIKDQNPQNFSSFSKLQGLKHNVIKCVFQDNAGNLWFGKLGGEVSKYDGQRFTHFSEKEGLNHFDVISIAEDKAANLWFATEGGGVIKYDGHRFTHYTEKEGISNNAVLSILADKQGNIWIGTNGGGVNKYDGKSFTHYTVREGLSHNIVSSILEDKAGNLWFGTGGGVNKFDGQEFTHYTEKEGLSDNAVISILEDQSGNLWFGTWDGGANKYDGHTFMHLTEKEGLGNNAVISMMEDKEGNLWFGSYGGGACKYDGKSLTKYARNEGLANNVISSMLEDKGGNLWFCTEGGGVNKYDGHRFTYFTEKEGLSNISVTSILRDKAGNLWFGTARSGIIRYDGHGFAHFTDMEGLNDNSVYCIIEDRSGNLWIGTGGGVSKYDGNVFTHLTENEGLINNLVLGILEDHSGVLWFGTRGGVSKYDGHSLTNYTEKEGLSHNSVMDILEDRSGILWFCTEGGGITKYDGKTFTHFTEKEGLAHNVVRSMLEDQVGHLWFCTVGGGVSRYDGQGFTHLGEREGLCHNAVFSILQGDNGDIWFGTRFGLARLTHDKLDELNKNVRNKALRESDVYFRSYTYDEGFLGIGVNGGKTIVEAADGTIWIGANDRLTAYHPPKNDVPDTIPPNIQLTSVGLFNENISWRSLIDRKDSSFVLGNGVSVGEFEFDGVSRWYGLPQELSLAYYNNYLTFNFIGITTNQPKKVKYQYILEGNDKNWSAITSKNEVAYGNLGFGTYAFKVRAMNSEGYWSEPFVYGFTIRPPWWKTWWAYSFYFLSVTASIWFYIKWRERKLRKEKEKLELTVEIRTAEVVAEKKEVEAQRHRSDELLLNILPQEVADELKAKGSADAKQIDEVTVLFTDFKGFTQLSEMLTPKELVAEINECFSAFDHIITRHNVEKIKTIGDAYMAAGGLPTPNSTHAVDVLKAALEIQQFMREHAESKRAKGELFFEIRIGVHTGPVVAGIVGVKKFAYDIWGDTVNIASRMESSGEVGKVNVSQSTYEKVKDDFRCVHRGKVQAKGKGEIDMYFVEAQLE